MNRFAFLLLASTALSACASIQPQAVETPAPPVTVEAVAPLEPQKSAHDRLFDLFKASDEANLKRNPLSALFRGDMRYAEHFGDYVSDEYYAAERAAAESDLAALRAIPRGELNATDQLAYDVFEYSTKISLRRLQPDLLALTAVRPMNHFAGYHTYYPTIASGQGAAPFKTLEDYENNLKRHAEFATYVDRSIERFRQGLESGVVETQMTVRNMIAQLDTQLKQKPEDSTYYGPIKRFPDSISAADRERLAAAYKAELTGEIYPALTRLRDFLKIEYLPK